MAATQSGTPLTGCGSLKSMPVIWTPEDCKMKRHASILVEAPYV